MTVTETVSPAKPKAKATPAKAKTPGAIPAEVEVGDIVLFAPPPAAVAAMRSVSGAGVDVWPAIVTFIFPDRVHAALKCMRPFAATDLQVRDAKYDPDGAPNTFRAKAPKVSPQV